MADDDVRPRWAPGATARESACAKVNLTFEVGRLREDGFHEVRSLMAGLDWCDAVRVRLGGRPGVVRLKVRGRGAPRGRRNLAVRAVEVWAAQDPGLGGVSIELQKRVPAGAGLGGGSSDAGAVLRALARLRPGRADPVALAPAVGSDVAFFARDLALAEAAGRGEELAAAGALPAAWRFVFALPPFALSTPAVYRRLDALRKGVPPAPGAATTRLRQLLEAVAAGGDGSTGEQALMDIGALLHNDLWPAALSLEPALGAVRERLRRAVGPDRPVAMTGSGSALFALVEDAGRAAGAVRRLRADGLPARLVPPCPGVGAR
jgi:4-diphosphocytidyl-2-C-methyl-D-erythritol kinase